MRLSWPPHPLGKFGHFGNKSLAFKSAFILLRLKTVCLYWQVELLVYTALVLGLKHFYTTSGIGNDERINKMYNNDCKEWDAQNYLLYHIVTNLNCVVCCCCYSPATTICCPELGWPSSHAISSAPIQALVTGTLYFRLSCDNVTMKHFFKRHICRMSRCLDSLFLFYHVSKGVKEQTFSQKLLWTEGSDPPPH